jgi:hypothetical protein
VSARKHHEIWIEQCEAARAIKARYGPKAAFDYLVGEKLMNFASAASQHPEFAIEFPRFISEVRRVELVEGGFLPDGASVGYRLPPGTKLPF